MTNVHLPFQSIIYDELPEVSIRLLDLIEDQDELGAIALRLRTYSLDDAPEYNALSYVWGRSTETHRVRCWTERNAQPAEISVSPNLFRALLRTRHASGKPIWIDAICINQADKSEKARLVPIMGEYYGRAAQVLVWLGPSDEGSDLAMEVLRWISCPHERESLQHRICGLNNTLTLSHLEALSSVLRSGVHIVDTASDLARLGLPGMKNTLWQALPALFQREWFYRVWTFQEIMLAKDATMLCGDRAISWTAFRQVGNELSSTQLMWVGREPGEFSPLRNYHMPRPDWRPFLVYLHGSRDRSCRFREDRIFGMLALAPPELRARIKVEYRESDPDHYIQTYRSAAVAIMEVLEIEGILTAASTGAGSPKLPSWCPDWSMKITSNVPPARFQACFEHYQLRSWSLDPSDENILQVRGQDVDVVDEVIDDYTYHWPNGVDGINGPADKMLRWLDRCAKLCRLNFRTEEMATAAFWKTLLSYDEIHGEQDFPSDPVCGLAAHRRRLAECRDSIPLAQTSLSSDEIQHLGEVLSHMGSILRGKVFFSTRHGTIGIANKGIAAGDKICLFFDVCKHLVLSPLGDDTCTLKSVAYVHGMMGDVAAILKERNGNKTLEESARMFRIR